MLKLYLLPLALLGGLAVAADEFFDEPLVLIKGDLTKAQFMERAGQRFTRQDSNGDGILSVAEREAAMARMQDRMKQSGKVIPGRVGKRQPMQDITREQFMARHETLFTRLDQNGDGVSDETERANAKARLGAGAMPAAQ